ncbi:MAG: hypothetical protein FJY88_09730 [Candidatus Eisenbacteria bacterium]|nr:hypothetical protein [Candidatus Eisenbacteria bacterium]
MRRGVPLFLTAFVGITYIVQFFVPHRPFSGMQDVLTDWVQIVFAFAIWLGVLNLMKVSGNKVYRKERDWPYAVVIVVSFLLMGVIGLFLSGGARFQDPGTPFDWMYQNVYNPLSATMFAILAFFVASASYRAFRARNREATLLLVAAFLVMLGRVPAGDALTGFLPEGYRLSSLADWIMNVPNKAGQRAIMIGIALGTVSTSLRLILGIERSHLGGER